MFTEFILKMLRDADVEALIQGALERYPGVISVQVAEDFSRANGYQFTVNTERGVKVVAYQASRWRVQLVRRACPQNTIFLVANRNTTREEIDAQLKLSSL